MCFYYSITRKSVNALVKGKIVKQEQVNLFDEQYIVNGFDHPRMPLITNDRAGEIQYFQWGFLPSSLESLQQANDFLGKYNTLNANASSISSSKLFSEAFVQRRCLVLCSGFFEWRKVNNEKIPYYITLQNDEVFVFAGIWNKTTDRKGNSLHSFAILTIDANEIMATIHNTKARMPLILSPNDAHLWLQPGLSATELNALLKPLPSKEFKAHTIKKFLPANAKNLNAADVIAYYHYPHVPDVVSGMGELF
jgi:putative SOS response-associated peptidase YedK